MWVRPTVLKVRAQRRALTYALADDIITEYLKTEAVPDILVSFSTSPLECPEE